MELLHATDVPLGLVTNGDRWLLVYAPRGDTTGFASWYANLWLEEPLWDQHVDAYVELARTLDIAICGTEWGGDGLSGLAATSEYIVRHAVDIVRSDVSWKGGVTGVKKTAALAEAFGLQCEIHMTLYAMLDLANLHVACAIPNCQYLELCAGGNCSFGLVEPPAIDREGYVHAPRRPGLGVEVDWKAIEALG